VEANEREVRPPSRATTAAVLTALRDTGHGEEKPAGWRVSLTLGRHHALSSVWFDACDELDPCISRPGAGDARGRLPPGAGLKDAVGVTAVRDLDRPAADARPGRHERRAAGRLDATGGPRLAHAAPVRAEPHSSPALSKKCCPVTPERGHGLPLGGWFGSTSATLDRTNRTRRLLSPWERPHLAKLHDERNSHDPDVDRRH